MQDFTPKLTIEVVPETCWFSNVRSNVSQSDWDVLRRATYKNAKYRCQICGGRGPQHPVECHEIWHYDDENKVQRLDGLIALCPSCHRVKHIGLSTVRGEFQEAAAHLSKVNGWDGIRTKEYIDEQREIWEERSQHEWQLDISWLQQFGINVLKPETEEYSSPGLTIREVYDSDLIEGRPALEWQADALASVNRYNDQSRATKDYGALMWKIVGVGFLVAALRLTYYLNS